MGLKPRAKSKSAAKTQPTSVRAEDFIAGLADERRQAESMELLTLLREVTGEAPVMWGPSIVGFGRYRYTYASGREGEWPRAGFSPRKQAMTIYCMPGFGEQKDLLDKLGPHKTGASCLYIRRLDDVNHDALRGIIERSLAAMKRLYGE